MGLIQFIVVNRTINPRVNMLQQVFVWLGWALAATINMLVVYGLYWYTRGDVTLSNATQSFYNAAHRTAWGIGLSWLIFACITGHGGNVHCDVTVFICMYF